MTPDKLKAALAMRDTHGITSIAKALGVSKASIYRALSLDQSAS